MKRSSTVATIAWTGATILMAGALAGASVPHDGATRGTQSATRETSPPPRVQEQASLRVKATPGTAEVYVDGYYAGRADQLTSALDRLHVAPGTHQVTLYLPGYYTLTKDVVLRPGTTYILRDTMEKLASGETSLPPPAPLAPLPASVSPQ